MKNLGLGLLLTMSVGITNAEAAVEYSQIYFDQPTYTANALNQQISVNLLADFSNESIIGGGLDVFFDQSIVNFNSFSFAPDFGFESNAVRPADELLGKLEGLAFGTFSFDGLNGTGTVGTFFFDTVGFGEFDLTLAATTNIVAGDFISNVTFIETTIDFGAPSTVSISAVPVPAAIWFMATGLISFMGFRKKTAIC